MHDMYHFISRLKRDPVLGCVCWATCCVEHLSGVELRWRSLKSLSRSVPSVWPAALSPETCWSAARTLWFCLLYGDRTKRTWYLSSVSSAKINIHILR